MDELTGRIIERTESFGTILYDPVKDIFSIDTDLTRTELLKQELSAPLTMHWMLTLKCNARCPYCYELPYLLNPRAEEDVLSEDAIGRFIKEYRALGGFRLYLTGGEPTLNPLLPAILNTAYDQQVKCVLSTNGVAMPEPVYEAIKKTGARLSISLDSYIEEEHNAERKQKSFSNIINILEQATQDNIDLRIISVAKDQDKNFWESFTRFLSNYGIKKWFIQPLLQEDTSINGKQLEKIVHDIDPDLAVRVLPAIFEGVLYMMPDGDIGTEVWSDKKKILGNVQHESLRDIWKMNSKKTVGDYQGLFH
jgi:sulfatase maturation enzyme AslB (radical SAM superfamily)